MRRTGLARRRGFVLAVAIVMTVVVGCVGGPGGPDASFPDRWEFPATVGAFERVSLDRDAGKQSIAGYNSTDPGLPVFVTLYVYRVGGVTSVGSPEEVVRAANAQATELQFEREKAAISQSHGGIGTLPASVPATLVMASSRHEGLFARFSFQERFLGRVQDLTSDIYYVRDGDWAVKVRVTHRAADDVAATEALRQWLTGLTWPSAR